ncbi:SIS domain-containing protein [Lactobacillus halodurans]|uniref:Fructosamine deglycase n=1 Tax=Companilactobacillus halodurans TaxID=2584183 RepID=A0A5P0ZP41_9LACO|nr:SIS domain-containing protein [Companilactobacillus halodurans]MQS76013.1 SIS domain-containing protein [Companilactobacillus halodurans]
MTEYTSQKDLKEMVNKIMSKSPELESIFFVGCGASFSELYGATYFLKQNAHKLKVQSIQANEFNYARPNLADKTAVVVVASLSGTTKESVNAVSNAKKWGCQTVALTHLADSSLTKDADFTIVHAFFEDYASKAAKQKDALGFAVEILEAVEGFNQYQKMLDGLKVVDSITNFAADNVKESAKDFGEKYKNEKTIFILASGPNFGVGYSTANFIFMEMQWIASPILDSGEYFHGPFELTVKDAPYLLFMSDGKTRHLVARALEFFQKFDAKYTVIDAKDFWLDSKIDSEVVDYFDPLVLTGAMRVYAEELSKARKHPLSKRRYMWKLENY